MRAVSSRASCCAVVKGPIILASAVAMASASIAAAQVATGWRGTGADALWSTSANWDNTAPPTARDLFFGNGWVNAGRTGSTTATNNLTGYNGHKIFFEDIANPVTFTLQGNTITLFDFGGASPVYPQIQNNSGALQILSIPVNFNDTSGNNRGDINAVNGDLRFDNIINLSGAVTQLRFTSGVGRTITFNAAITSSGNGGANTVAINTANNIVINAAATYTGSTFVNAGRLQIGSGGSLTSTVRLGNTSGTESAALDFLDTDGGFTFDRTINPRAGSTGNTLSVNSLNTSGTNTYSGHFGLDHDLLVTQAAGGTLAITQVRSSPADTTTGFDIKGFTSTFDVAAGGLIEVSGTIYNSVDNGSVVKSGPGVLRFTGLNTYTGPTSVTGGTLQVGLGGNLGAIQPASISLNGALRLDAGTINTGNIFVGSTGGGAYHQTSGALAGQTLTLGPVDGSTGVVNMAGGSITLSNRLSVGDRGNGTFGHSDGIVSAAIEVAVGGSTASSSNYLMSGGTLSTDALVVGRQGAGTYLQTGGRTLVSDGLLMSTSGGTGTYVLQAGTLSAGFISMSGHSAFTYSAAANLNFGTFFQAGGNFTSVANFTLPANSTYRLFDGAMTSNQDILLGFGAATGSKLVQDGGTLTVGNDFAVGVDAPGSVEQTGGVVNANGTDSLRIGLASGGAGTYTLSGGTLNLNGIGAFTGSLKVGEGGQGTLIVTGGKLTSRGVVSVGIQNGSVGKIVQSGGDVVVGEASPGPGASVFVGRGPGATGNYSLANGSLTVHGNLRVGFEGTGQYTQDSGRTTVTRSGGLYIANSVLSTASVTINGGTLSTEGGIFIGGDPSSNGGPGTLTVGGTGYVISNATLCVRENGVIVLNPGGTVDNGLGPDDNVVNNGQIINNGGTLIFGGRIITTSGGGFAEGAGTGLVKQTGGALSISDRTTVDVGDMEIAGGTATANGTFIIGRSAASDGQLTVTGGSVTVNGVLGVGNNGTLGAGNATADGRVDVSGGSLFAQTVVLGNSAGGSGEMNVSGTGNVTVGGGFSTNALNVTGGTVTVLDQAPPPGEDPVLDRALVGGYLRDGAMTVSGGVVTSPRIKLGVTNGNTGTYTQSGGTVNVGVFGSGNDGTLTAGAGDGHAFITGGTLNADTIVLGSSVGGDGDMTVSGTGQVNVGGGFSMNTLNVNGGTVTVLDQAPPPGEDPVLDRAIVGGYLRDGAMNVTAGVVTTPRLKLGVSNGNAGTYTQSGGTLNVGILGVGNDATMTAGQGVGQFDLSGGTVNADTVLLGSTAGGTGHMTVSGTGNLVVGGGFSVNSLSVSGGTVTVLDQAPPPGEDPVLDRSIVAGYLRDGGMNVTGGVVSTPNLKIGVTFGNTGTYAQSGGSVAVSTLSVASSAGGSGNLTLSGGSLRVNDLMLVRPNGSVEIGAAGQLDLSDAAAIFDYTGASPAAALASDLVSGYANGQWTGNGINSSAAASVTSTALGYAEASEIGSPATFLGQDIDATTVLIRYTRYGDADLSGTVDIDDFGRLASNFNTPGGWSDGDFDYSGTIDIDDFGRLATNFNQGVPAGLAARPVAVPEPLSVVVPMLGWCFARRRSRTT